MLVVSLLILSIAAVIITLIVHDRDEIYRMVALFSGLVAIICTFILTPLVIKCLLLLLFFTIRHKLFLVYHSFEE